MSPDQFLEWLKEYSKVVREAPDHEQWDEIQEVLGSVKKSAQLGAMDFFYVGSTVPPDFQNAQVMGPVAGNQISTC